MTWTDGPACISCRHWEDQGGKMIKSARLQWGLCRKPKDLREPGWVIEKKGDDVCPNHQLRKGWAPPRED